MYRAPMGVILTEKKMDRDQCSYWISISVRLHVRQFHLIAVVQYIANLPSRSLDRKTAVDPEVVLMVFNESQRCSTVIDTSFMSLITLMLAKLNT